MPVIALEPLALALMAFSMPLSAASGSSVYGLSGTKASVPINSAASDSSIAGINLRKLLDCVRYDPVRAVKNTIKDLVGSFYAACRSTTSLIPRAATSTLSHLDVEVGSAVDSTVTHSTSNPTTHLGSRPITCRYGAGDAVDMVDEVADAAGGQVSVAVGQVTGAAEQAGGVGQVVPRNERPTASVNDTEGLDLPELINEAVSQRNR